MEALALETIRSTETRTFNGAGCPAEWLFDAADEYNGRPRKPRSFFERGTLGHAMIETYLLGDEDYDAAIDLLDAYRPPVGEWLETTKCTKDGLYNEVAILFDHWVEQYVDMYQGLFSHIDTEVRLQFETPNGTVVDTTADAIVHYRSGRVAVVDWKLGTSKSGADMQLYVYWYGMRKMGLAPSIQRFDGWFHYVTYSNPITYTKSDGVYPGDRFVEEYIDTADKRRKEGPWLPNPSWMSCAYCEHKDRCPIYGGVPTTNPKLYFV